MTVQPTCRYRPQAEGSDRPPEHAPLADEPAIQDAVVGVGQDGRELPTSLHEWLACEGSSLQVWQVGGDEGPLDESGRPDLAGKAAAQEPLIRAAVGVERQQCAFHDDSVSQQVRGGSGKLRERGQGIAQVFGSQIDPVAVTAQEGMGAWPPRLEEPFGVIEGSAALACDREGQGRESRGTRRPG